MIWPVFFFHKMKPGKAKQSVLSTLLLPWLCLRNFVFAVIFLLTVYLILIYIFLHYIQKYPWITIFCCYLSLTCFIFDGSINSTITIYLCKREGNAKQLRNQKVVITFIQNNNLRNVHNGRIL